jgi:hypothetical protein
MWVGPGAPPCLCLRCAALPGAAPAAWGRPRCRSTARAARTPTPAPRLPLRRAGASGLENNDELVAYWKFNDPDQDGGIFRRHTVAKDSSGKGNDLSLLNPPLRHDVTINSSLSTGAPPPPPRPALLRAARRAAPRPAARPHHHRRHRHTHTHTHKHTPPGPRRAGKLEFKNNVALGKAVKGFPDKSFTVEFWARGPALDEAHPPSSQELNSQFFSYATQEAAGDGKVKFLDDAIRCGEGVAGAGGGWGAAVGWSGGDGRTLACPVLR